MVPLDIRRAGWQDDELAEPESPGMSDPSNARLLLGDALTVLPTLEAGSVHCVVTSPPYWGLRKYSGEQERVWGGRACSPLWCAHDDLRCGGVNCEHEWGMAITGKSQSGSLVGSTLQGAPPGEERRPSWTSDSCLRCGAWRGAYGLEPTPEMWVEHTMEWLRAVRRVLRDDGAVWLNVGSSYSAGGRGDSATPKQASNKGSNDLGPQKAPPGYKPLDLVWAAALLYPALLREGWWVRSVVIWAKPNPMPESVSGWRWEQHRVKIGGKGTKGPTPAGWDTQHKSDPTQGRYDNSETSLAWAPCPGCSRCAPNDGLVLRKGSWRPTSSHEEILMLTKGSGYFADGEGVREAQVDNEATFYTKLIKAPHKHANEPFSETKRNLGQATYNPAGRNLRDVWTFSTQPFPGAHFATFPEELVHRCILASTPEKVCAACGEPWVRVVERKPMVIKRTDWGDQAGNRTASSGTMKEPAESHTVGFRPTCSCNADTRPAVVLDPFGGSGTVSVVARKLGRASVYIDISEDYLEMARKRLQGTQPALSL